MLWNRDQLKFTQLSTNDDPAHGYTPSLYIFQSSSYLIYVECKANTFCVYKRAGSTAVSDFIWDHPGRNRYAFHTSICSIRRLGSILRSIASTWIRLLQSLLLLSNSLVFFKLFPIRFTTVFHRFSGSFLQSWIGWWSILFRAADNHFSQFDVYYDSNIDNCLYYIHVRSQVLHSIRTSSTWYVFGRPWEIRGSFLRRSRRRQWGW